MTTVFQIVGSLGLFLFGMKLMSEGLQRLSGERLRAMMRFMTGNRFKGVLSGLLVTGAIQSSSATTVMVVSFVNAKLLTLRESIGVIMGANLGTTATAWIIALLGFKFSLSHIALPLVGIGAVFTFLKRDGARNFGTFLVGFGLLFMGLDLLKASVPDIQSSSATLEWIRSYADMGFLSVLLFLAFGVVLTLVVQSSSVAMAITITMAAKGWISFDLAAAVVLGENIGTTVTANLAAIPAGLNAKRAAVAHLLFNVLGVCWMLAVFYGFLRGVAWLVPLKTSVSPEAAAAFGIADFESLTGAARTAALERMAIPERLALFHTLFNAANIAVLIGFVPQLEKLTRLILRGHAAGDADAGVEARLASLSTAPTGEFALYEGRRELANLAALAGKMFHGFAHVIRHPERDLSAEVSALKKMEDESDAYARALTDFFARCSGRDLGEAGMRTVTRCLLTVPEWEQMCDSCRKLVGLARKRYRGDLRDEILRSEIFMDFCRQMEAFVDFSRAGTLAEDGVAESLERARRIREDLRRTRKALKETAIAQMQTGGVTRGGILFIELLAQCERVGANAMNILEILAPKTLEEAPAPEGVANAVAVRT